MSALFHRSKSGVRHHNKPSAAPSRRCRLCVSAHFLFCCLSLQSRVLISFACLRSLVPALLCFLQAAAVLPSVQPRPQPRPTTPLHLHPHRCTTLPRQRWLLPQPWLHLLAAWAAPSWRVSHSSSGSTSQWPSSSFLAGPFQCPSLTELHCVFQSTRAYRHPIRIASRAPLLKGGHRGCTCSLPFSH